MGRLVNVICKESRGVDRTDGNGPRDPFVAAIGIEIKGGPGIEQRHG